LKQHNPWYYEECLKLIDQRKQNEVHWLHNTSQTNGDHMNNVRHETVEVPLIETENNGKKKLMSL
jgi:hypothetical protein